MINLAESLITSHLTHRSPTLLDEAIGLLEQTFELSLQLPIDGQVVRATASLRQARALAHLVAALIYRFRDSSQDEDILRACECATIMSATRTSPAIETLATTSLFQCFRELADLNTKNPLYLEKILDLGFMVVELLLDRHTEYLPSIFHTQADALFSLSIARGDSDSARMERFLNLLDPALTSPGFCPDNSLRADLHYHAAIAAIALSIHGGYHLSIRMSFMQLITKHLEATCAIPECRPEHRNLALMSRSVLGAPQSSRSPPEFPSSKEVADMQLRLIAFNARPDATKASTELTFVPLEKTLSILDYSVLRAKACLELAEFVPPNVVNELLRAASGCCLLRFKCRRTLYERRILTPTLAEWRKSITLEELEEDYENAVFYSRAATEIISAEAECDFLSEPEDMLFSLCQLASALVLEYQPLTDPTTHSKDLGEVIRLLQPFVSSNVGTFGASRTLASRTLVDLLTRRFLVSRDNEDADHADRLTASLMEDRLLPPDSRVGLATLRFQRAHLQSRQAALQAYYAALDLSEDLLSTEPALDVYSVTLELLSDMLTPATTHALDLGELRVAVEVLERGRALLWTHMRRLRTPVDALVESTEPRVRDLGRQFHRISDELSELNLSSHGEGQVACQFRLGNLTSATVGRKARLTRQLNSIITEIRGIPGFTHFLLPPSFESLQRAASAEGPVVIVHCAVIRSFALIILHNRDPVYVDLYNAMEQLSEDNGMDILLDLSYTRYSSGLSSNKHRRVLRDVLKKTADVIVGPVVEKLIRLGIEPGKGKRVWWCPTGAATMLPLHAAGPLRSPDPKFKRPFFMDLYVSSYTPTLSALIEARSRDITLPSSNTAQALLLVGQPQDPSLANVEVELNTVLSVLPSETRPTALLDQEASRSAVSNALRNHGWLHIACHCIPDLSMPTESGFKLGHDENLKMSEIIGLHLPHAQFAFLSACSTAVAGYHMNRSGGVGEAFDEVFNPAAAMQFCGFRSVVGTMWAMDDEDRPTVARDFYQEFFRPPKDGEMKSYVWDPRRAAHALNKAVKKLRKSLAKEKGSLERWVNFIHIGI